LLYGLFVSLLLVSSVAEAQSDLRPPAGGSDRVPVDILRPTASYPRIFVQVEMPDGKLGLFMVDTGADVSVLSKSTAERLGLDIQERYSRIAGLSGESWMDRAVIPWIGLGADEQAIVHDIEVAVDVRGMTDSVHFMPLDGLLGNNVWSNFILDIDYPKNEMMLHAPDTLAKTRKKTKGLWKVKAKRGVAPMVFDGNHVFSPITVVTDSTPPTTETFVTQVDTGAGELTVCAGTGAPFEQAHTQGLESIRGIGASETLPPHRFLEKTRRVPLDRVILGGQRFDVGGSARWLLYEERDSLTCPSGMRALLGHEYLRRHRVIFDYNNGRLALLKSKGKPQPVNGHEIMLAQDIANYGVHAPERALFRAKQMVGADQAEGATELLLGVLDSLDVDERAEAQVLLARLHRFDGDLDAAWEALRPLGPAQLVDQGEIIGSVNGLILADRADEAIELADAAVKVSPDEGDALVARADALLHLGRLDEASEDLLAASKLVEFPDAHLLRRARIALARDDRYGSMAHVRKLLQLYPFGGEFLWFYAMLVESERDAATFRADMSHAMDRLHPGMRPTDFQVAAHHVLGDQDEAVALMQQGITKLCEPAADTEDAMDNCLAWFWSLAGIRQDESLKRIERALSHTGPRSDYLDTKAMVHLARGELDLAVDAAWAAARQSPDDVYMLWQAERIADLRDSAQTTWMPPMETP
jgi:tetratricopeptide (TPR) repeat protein